MKNIDIRYSTEISPFLLIKERWKQDKLIEASIMLFGLNIKRLSPGRNSAGDWMSLVEFRGIVNEVAKGIEKMVHEILVSAGWVPPATESSVK